MDRILTAADYVTTPWKNGQGSTTEIARHPLLSASAFDFAWRISMAPVVADGPFSVFPGIERTLVVIEGAGIDLHFGDGARQRALLGFPVQFDGGDTVEGRLIDGPVRDFNVMARRGVYRGTTTVLQAADGQLFAAGPAETLLVHVAGGSWRAAMEDRTLDLPAGGTLRPGGGRNRALRLHGAGTAIVVKLSPA